MLVSQVGAAVIVVGPLGTVACALKGSVLISFLSISSKSVAAQQQATAQGFGLVCPHVIEKRLYRQAQTSNCENNSIETATELTERCMVDGRPLLMQPFVEVVMASTSVEMRGGESLDR